MRHLSDLFRNKDNKLMINIAVIFALGVLLLSFSGKFLNAGVEDNTPVSTAGLSEMRTQGESYEQQLERRLEETLCQVDGVGKVKVMLTLAVGKEIVVQSDGTVEESTTTETDGAGGSREQKQNKQDSKTVFSQKNGTNEPLVIKEIEPRIEGVIIIAEGGGDVVIKDMLIRACQSLLGIELHKIQVLKMK